MSAVLDVMKQYTTLAGYAISTNKNKNFYSDLFHLENSFKNAGLHYNFITLKVRTKFLDAGEIFDNNVIKGFLKGAYDISYRGGLEEVAQAYIRKGKLEGISGANVDSILKDTTIDLGERINKQLDYCLLDAVLCYELLQKNNFELLNILYEISQEVKFPFFSTCNTQYPTRWWKSKLASINYQKIPIDVQEWMDENTTYDNDGKKKNNVKYIGAYVANPKVGRYLGAASYDVASMYPTMSIIHNISTETVNCNCCKNNPTAYVPNGVMKLINDYVMKENRDNLRKPRPWHYWICQKKRGQFSEVMAKLMELKRQYKKSGEKLKEKAIKILMNSGYGCFGNAYFEYRDTRVAELITSYGQYTIRQLEEYAGDKMIYGDTDSIYLTSIDNNLIAKATELNVTLEFERGWKGLFLTSNMKQYFGLTTEGKLISKTLTGMKSNQPDYFNEVTEKLISKEFMELVIETDNLENISAYIRSAFAQLTEIDVKQLRYSQEAKKALYEYKNNGKEREMYKEILERCEGNEALAKLESSAGKVYHYWKITGEQSYTQYLGERQLDFVKYKTELFTCIEPILEAYGMNKEDITELHDKLILKEKKKKKEKKRKLMIRKLG